MRISASNRRTVEALSAEDTYKSASGRVNAPRIHGTATPPAPQRHADPGKSTFLMGAADFLMRKPFEARRKDMMQLADTVTERWQGSQKALTDLDVLVAACVRIQRGLNAITESAQKARLLNCCNPAAQAQELEKLQQARENLATTVFNAVIDYLGDLRANRTQAENTWKEGTHGLKEFRDYERSLARCTMAVGDLERLVEEASEPLQLEPTALPTIRNVARNVKNENLRLLRQAKFTTSQKILDAALTTVRSLEGAMIQRKQADVETKETAERAYQAVTGADILNPEQQNRLDRACKNFIQTWNYFNEELETVSRGLSQDYLE